ncbi:hypothetical protein [Candidatus Phytoplasma fraxini]|uniref:hypothetical protein n=1 Tax=Ash yellows phytoplasma TaxID=35780 RepID=UPI0030FEFF44
MVLGLSYYFKIINFIFENKQDELLKENIYQDKIIEVEKPVEKIIYQDKFIEVEKPIIKLVEKIIYQDRIIDLSGEEKVRLSNNIKKSIGNLPIYKMKTSEIFKIIDNHFK